jgi:DNA-binding HxlR family transcriptional regulator
MSTEQLEGVQGVMAAVDVLGGKWKILILWHLRAKTQRYGELRRLIPQVTEKMLIQQLRELEADGIIQRIAYPSIPPHVEYSFTDYGTTLVPIIKALCGWGRAHIEQGQAEQVSG